MKSVDLTRVCFPSHRPQMDEIKNALKGRELREVVSGGGTDKARAKERDGVGNCW